MSEYNSDYFRYKSIRDPLYGFVDLTKTEIQIIDTPVFRRLLNIKQLSHAFVVYPSAIHTRFEHSLGATHLADLVSRQLEFPNEIREVVRLTALLHDVGHGPYSHLFEEVLSTINKRKVEHDWISTLIIRQNKELRDILGDKGEYISALLRHREIDSWKKPGISTLASDVVSSALDVDKLDYLRRDSFHIGVAYGQFDLARIIHTLTSTPDEREKRLCIKSKGKDAIENYRLGRYLMHAQVYKHHARIVADQMFLKALDLAFGEEAIIDKVLLTVNLDDELKNDNFLEYYTGLDDRRIYDEILQKGPNSKSASILKNILKRQLYKRVHDFLPDKEILNAQTRDRIMKMNDPQFKELSQQIADNVGLQKHEVIVYRAEIPINLYENEILMLWKGVPRTLDEFSPIKTSESTINKFYVFAPKGDEIKNKIRKFVESKLGVPSET
ncbi:MAG: HD domain-containing protein [Nitrososphaera sp.]